MINKRLKVQKAGRVPTEYIGLYLVHVCGPITFDKAKRIARKHRATSKLFKHAADKGDQLYTVLRKVKPGDSEDKVDISYGVWQDELIEASGRTRPVKKRKKPLRGSKSKKGNKLATEFAKKPQKPKLEFKGTHPERYLLAKDIQDIFSIHYTTIEHLFRDKHLKRDEFEFRGNSRIFKPDDVPKIRKALESAGWGPFNMKKPKDEEAANNHPELAEFNIENVEDLEDLCTIMAELLKRVLAGRIKPSAARAFCRIAQTIIAAARTKIMYNIMRGDNDGPVPFIKNIKQIDAPCPKIGMGN